jgi:hypothetical protein
LQPPNENGWFWSGSGVKIGPTTQRNTGDWSYTGGYNQAQPDNREAAQVSIDNASGAYVTANFSTFSLSPSGQRRIMPFDFEQFL